MGELIAWLTHNVGAIVPLVAYMAVRQEFMIKRDNDHETRIGILETVVKLRQKPRDTA